MSASHESLLGPVCQIAIPARQTGGTADFYRETLGLEIDFTAGPMTFFKTGQVRLMVGPAGNLEPGTGAPVYFSTQSVRQCQKSLSGKGVSFHPDPVTVDKSGSNETLLWFFIDPEGNMLALLGPA